MGLLARLIWMALVILAMVGLVANALIAEPDAKSAMQVSQLWDQVSGIALALIAITLAWWLAMWKPRRDE